MNVCVCVCVHQGTLNDALNASTLTHQVAGCEARHLGAAMPIKHRKYAGVWIAPQPHSGDVRILLHIEERACMSLLLSTRQWMLDLSGWHHAASPHRVLLHTQHCG